MAKAIHANVKIALTAVNGRLRDAGGSGRRSLETASTAADGQERSRSTWRRAPRGSVLWPVYWVRPEFVIEVTCLAWTDDELLRQVVYEGLQKTSRRATLRALLRRPKPSPPVENSSRSAGRKLRQEGNQDASTRKLASPGRPRENPPGGAPDKGALRVFPDRGGGTAFPGEKRYPAGTSTSTNVRLTEAEIHAVSMACRTAVGSHR